MTASNAVSEGNEYICISCWTSFVSKGESGEIACPHCGYVQPSADGYLGAGGGAAKPAPVAPVPEMDHTLQDMPMPWAAGGAGAAPTKRPGGLEPISFDDLEELEQLLSEDPRAKRAAAAAAAEAPTTVIAAVPDVAEDAGPAEAAAATAAPAEDITVWRLKTDSGLTYSFYSPDSLSRWADGLSSQKGRMVSVDGMSWKSYDQFLQNSQGGADPMQALSSSATAKPAQAPVLSAPAPAPGPTSGARSQPRNTTREQPLPQKGGARPSTQTAVGARQNTKTASMPTAERKRSPSVAVAGAEARAEKDSPPRGAAPNRTRTGSMIVPTRDAPSDGAWGLRVLFMGLGLAVGGAGVYFGMYLLGFYDLVSPF